MNIVFYDKHTDDGLIIDILNRYKIYDIDVYRDGEDLIACDEDTTWKNMEIFEFLEGDVFIYTDGKVDLLSDETWERYCALKLSVALE